MSDKGFKINRRVIEKMQKEISKEFERAARKHPVRVPVQTVMPDVSLGAEAPQRPFGTVEADPYQSLLLLWLSERGNENQTVNISVFIADQELSQDDARAVVVQLEYRELIKVATSLAGKDVTKSI